jgi:zinc protease
MNMVLALTVALLFSGCAFTNQSSLNKSTKGTYKNERVVQLENGLKIYFVQDDSLPRVNIQMLIPVGNAYEPAGLEGLSVMTAELLDKGTKNKNALEISDLLSDSGSGFGANANYDFTVLSTQSLTTEFPKVLDLFIKILKDPQFPNEEIERVRQLMIVTLQSRKDRSGTLADIEMTQSFYSGHHYGRDLYGTTDSLKKIKREDVLAFYNKHYHPKGSYLAVSGRISNVIEKQIVDQMKNWKSDQPREVLKVPFQAQSQQEKIRVVSTPHKAQTEIRIIQPGIPRAHPDFLKYRLANEILGGSFASRLNQKIRDDLGLTYSIYSYLDNRDVAGAWVISTFSKNEAADRTISEIQKLVSEFATQGITSDELFAAKNLAKAQLPRALETSDKLAYNLMALDFYGIGSNYLIRYNDSIDRITKDQVNQVIRKHFRADQMEIISFR